MARRLLGIVLLGVSYNFLFISDSANHTTIGWVWLVVALVVWWPDVMRLLRRLGLV